MTRGESGILYHNTMDDGQTDRKGHNHLCVCTYVAIHSLNTAAAWITLYKRSIRQPYVTFRFGRLAEEAVFLKVDMVFTERPTLTPQI